MNVLVTGASGFIGQKLTPQLMKSGHTVHSVSRSLGVDVTNWEDVKRLEPVEVIFHLAGLTDRHAGSRDKYLVNWLGTLNLIEFGRLNNVRLIVLASSYPYGLPQYLPVDEEHPLLGKGSYTKSKIFAEELCQAYAEEFGLPIVSLRIFNPYGPSQKGELLIPTILSQIVEGKEIVLMNPEPKRDFVYIDDVVEAFLLMSSHSVPGFHSYNVATGVSIPVNDLVQEICKSWGTSIPVRYTGERRANEIMDCRGSSDRIFQTIGWAPKVSIEEGINRTVHWWKTHGDVKLGYR